MVDFNVNKNKVNIDYIKPENANSPEINSSTSIVNSSIFQCYDTDFNGILSDEEIKSLAEDYSKSNDKTFKKQVENFIHQAKNFAEDIMVKFTNFLEQIQSKITVNKTEKAVVANNLRNTTTTVIDEKTTNTVTTRTDKNGKLISEQTRIETKNDDGTISVKFTEKSNDKEYTTEFTYSREKLSDFIIENSPTGEKFGNLKKILSKNKEDLTETEQKLLADYNNLLDIVISAGTDYGVDPNLILTIILRETKFNGSAKGKFGKGYMQLTSSPINDMCGADGSNKVKTKVYGAEVAELLEENGFNISNPNKKNLAANVRSKINNNNDWDFNIRMGTILLRRYLRKANNNVEIAAQKYNGSSQKISYGKFVNSTYFKLLQDYALA